MTALPDRPETLARIRSAGVLAVLRAPSADAAIAAADALIAGGVRGIEVTYSTPDVPAALAGIRARHGDGVVLGAGTLLDPSQAAEAAAAGAQYLVAPGLDDELVEAMAATGAVVMAGAVTPTEVMRARRLPVDVVKLFPGSLGGPALLKGLRGPFPDLSFLPTGGVSAANVGEWLAAGALAVAAGGELCPAAALRDGDWDDVRGRARSFADALDAARGAAGVAA
ncbi:bifunctional 4-hydroxy-2-oxoglutarate aldolase/2-dehydro-3-deoxy-phosphogluconate aldolase [Conexibacter stalactiti]|uniref:Bifunctional 4-hydroxy-2-oxoglutarate aldolase/2-dehydro-3-deoxy-phosphogluconate aldolase n=1 Tax=Conexibacter stalactiti TaxID=1940611 RepID=A0ABU4HQN3_9ACTN|nr:bifunctional 4-hydroxy-2-oxoglutarate aldolase/2-dehydro-3-deoxy-phosphogluconate aldolase [Conexibacter stalactiti]MDW5595615.1 bifunctional 4-hydroxy-2-oxoglutarate aldolase/2-dehydro-3-deoxy-phosphogluconate aldolase [Conexibacter stalactiti]MEC5036257.1 bifunctional 4-hydroxy-2-oxoglutarate aldolase/2-dehydro-3-deoxy-phosphogluconate aldolase [Conexibacter stalactiti]